MSEPEKRRYSDDLLRAYLDGRAAEADRLALDAALEGDADLERRLLDLDEFAGALARPFNGLLKAAPAKAMLSQLTAPLMQDADESAADKAEAVEPDQQAKDRQAAAPPISRTLPVSGLNRQEDFVTDFKRPQIEGDASRTGLQTGSIWRWPGYALAASLLFAAGFFGHAEFAPAPDSSAEAAPAIEEARAQTQSAPAPIESPDWSMAVANQVRLYTPDTFSLERRPVALREEIDHAGEAVGLNLRQLARMDGFTLARAERLEHRGAALVQAAFTTGSGQVIVFGILDRPASAGAEPAAELRPLSLAGLQAVSWDGARYSYLVIGDVGPDEADALARRLSLFYSG